MFVSERLRNVRAESALWQSGGTSRGGDGGVPNVSTEQLLPADSHRCVHVLDYNDRLLEITLQS